MNPETEYAELKKILATLTERVYKLEQRSGLERVIATADPKVSMASDPSVAKPAPPSDAKPPLPPLPQADLESTIGANWLNRVGIVAVLIGVSSFLKYAFDNAWVGPPGRVLIGLSGGLGIVYWSEYFRSRAHTSFSYSLKAIGLAVLYLSLWTSSQLYALVSTEMAFVGMIAVTACTVLMALMLNSEIIAGFAALGGLLTPALLSSGENRAASLFGYITMLDFGVLLVWSRRPWARVALGTFVGSVILFSAWHARYYSADQFLLAFIAGSACFAIFVVLPLVGRDRDSLGVSLLTLANAGIYFIWVWDLLDSIGQRRTASLGAIVLGAFYFLLASRVLPMRSDRRKPLYWTLGISFLIVAVPIGLDAQWITIAWIVEAGALMWISRGTSTGYCVQLGSLTLVMGLFRLVLIDRFAVTRAIFNERMLAYAVAVTVLLSIAKMLAARRRKVEPRLLPAVILSVNILVLLGLGLEISDAFPVLARNFTYSALWMCYGAGLMFVGFWKNLRFLRWQALVLIAMTVAKVFLYDTLSLDRGYRIVSFIALGVLLLGTSFFYQRDWFKLKERVD